MFKRLGPLRSGVRFGMALQLGGVIAVALTLSNCAVSPLARRASAFGTAASGIVRNSSDAYSTVESAVYDAQVSSIVLDFDTKGFDPNKIKPFLSGPDLEVRVQLLKSLQRYADLLQYVAGDRPIAQLDTEVSGFGQQLKNLTGNPSLQRLGPTVGDAQIKGLTTALDVVAQLVIERKRQKALPPILAKMQDAVERICAVLDADLGNRLDADGIGGRGLRGQLWVEYDRILDNQKDYIVNNKAALLPHEKAVEIAKLPTIVRQQGMADNAFAATQTALRNLAKTHRDLLADPKKDSSFAGHLAELKDSGQRIADFYNGLKFK